MIQVVCIKQVADSETRVKVAADGRTLDPAGVTWILNPYDEFAVEQALRIKEQQGSGEVVVVSLGPASVQTTLRNALAMGADRGIHLKTDAPSPDPLAVSPQARGRAAGILRRPGPCVGDLCAAKRSLHARSGSSVQDLQQRRCGVC